MTQDAMAHLSGQYQNVLAPIIKVNKLAAANLETLVNFQTNALQSYVDLAISRMRAAADINDATSLQAFLSGQAEVFTRLQQQFVDDANVLGELIARFKAEFDQLAQDSLSAGKK